MNIDAIKIKEFTDLKVWQEGHKLVLVVYKDTQEFPKSETYSLVDQMRRAVISITNNIAEGFGRQTYKEKVQFFYMAQGSITELKNQVFICRDLGYLSDNQVSILMSQIQLTHQLLQGLITKSKSFIKS